MWIPFSRSSHPIVKEFFGGRTLLSLLGVSRSSSPPYPFNKLQNLETFEHPDFQGLSTTVTTNRYKDVYYVCFSDPPLSPADYLELLQRPSTARSPPKYRLDSLLERFTDSNNSESDSDSAVVSPTYRARIFFKKNIYRPTPCYFLRKIAKSYLCSSPSSSCSTKTVFLQKMMHFC